MLLSVSITFYEINCMFYLILFSRDLKSKSWKDDLFPKFYSMKRTENKIINKLDS